MLYSNKVMVGGYVHVCTSLHVTRNCVRTCIYICMYILADLSRMFLLVSRVPKGLEELRDRFENHVHSQGVAAVEKCGETALNVSKV